MNDLKRPLKHGSLFSGIGGFDLAAQWMGWENVFHCEWNEFGQRILKHYWPNAITYHDITQTDFTIHRGTIDILTGGFPCQPYSAAGKRLGKEDDRHLWPEMLRAIREIQPTWVVGENVLGLVNWNGGLVFDEVQADLEAQGYEVQPYVLPACSVNAPHRRDRVWFVAYRNGSSKGSSRQSGEIEGNWSKNNDESKSGGTEGKLDNGCSDVLRYASNTNGSRLQKARTEQQTTRIEQYGELDEQESTSNPESQQSERMRSEQRELSEQEQGEFGGNGSELGGEQYAANADGFGLRGESNRAGESGQLNKASEAGNWENFPTQSPVCSGNDGLPTKLDGITFRKWRNESLKAYGNAVVPQVVHQIFKSIQQYIDSNNHENLPIRTNHRLAD